MQSINQPTNKPEIVAARRPERLLAFIRVVDLEGRELFFYIKLLLFNKVSGGNDKNSLVDDKQDEPRDKAA